MELRHLRYFVAVAETENVSRAAQTLHVSQPAVSRQIRDLEDELNLPLFERSAKSVRLTQAGRLFLDEARAVLARAEEAVEMARKTATAGQQEIHVGYAPSLTARLLPATLRAFAMAAPSVCVRLHDLSTQEMLERLRQKKLDFILLARTEAKQFRGLEFEQLARDPLCVAVPPAHRLARKRFLPVDEFGREPLIAYSQKDYPEYHKILAAVFETTRAKPGIVEEHESVTGLIAAVEAGTGLALVTRSLGCTAGQRLKLLDLVPEPPPLSVGLAWRKERLTKPEEQFLACAKVAANRSAA